MSLTAVDAPAETPPLMNVLVLLGEHPVFDWTGTPDAAQAYADAMARRFPSLAVKVAPVGGVEW